ncbi:TRAP-type C4-dicarboxylate transport system, small permease component [Belliella baltica DSM 15883]|uniref:TRAP-type C4-dicarboxylate transport system, small permease component n=1 Tax=Belliella baltica (strain DSM 15883 / CIP 108006 / LMG 21964 / BA134) TaxID=866536 RepID=I3Z8N0_BELBD|nr:TRAP transporter small permease [Belliella baltica]AFL85598.1 TRAP-type C4-dicarboxylate transport system, small permease component [Belliella baltica DSM 15883]
MFSIEFKENLDKIIGWLLIFLMGSMVLNVTWQVLSRYIFQNPSSFTDELSRYMLIWLGMLGAAYVAGKNQHLAIDIVLRKLEGKAKMKLQILINVLIMVFAIAAMILGGSNLVYITYLLGQKSATLQIPLAYIYSIIPASGLLVLYYQIAGIFHLIKTQNHD